MTEALFDLVRMACDLVGVWLVQPVLLRDGENVVWKVNESTIVRLARPGQLEAVRREVDIANWLACHEFPAVRLAEIASQPVEVGGRPATFWQAIAPHRPGTVKDVARLLRRLHDLPVPTDFDAGSLQPFVRLEERISGSGIISTGDGIWLLKHLAELRERWKDLPSGMPLCVVHGDAWVGNIAVDDSGNALMLDLERAAVGPPEWDLASTAIKVGSFGWVAPQEYQDFVEIYGSDVTTWTGFELVRDIRELRMTTYLLQKAGSNQNLVSDAQFRVDCLRGRSGPRPWAWTPWG